MRTFDAIYADIKVAVGINDAGALELLAEEMAALGTHEAEAAVSFSRGLARSCGNDHSMALKHYKHALTLYEELGDSSGVANVKNNIGKVHFGKGDYSTALEHFHSALALFEMQGKRSGVAWVLGNIGTVHDSTGDYHSALEYYHRALALYEELGDRRGVAQVTCDIGNVYYGTGDYPTALEHYHIALAVHMELGDRIGVARVTGNIGNVNANTGDYRAALEHYHRALALYEELGNRSGTAAVTANIGNVHYYSGDYPAALEQNQSALAQYEQIGERSGVALVTGNIGNIHNDTGDYTAALEHYHRALALHEELGDRSGVARVTGNIGNVRNHTSDYPAALEHYHRSLAVYEELGEHSSVARAMGWIVSALLSSEQDDAANTILDKQTAIRMDDPVVRAEHYANRATIAERRGDLDRANEHLRQALAFVTNAGARNPAATYHQRLRDLAQRSNDFPGYIEHNNEYNRITEEIRGKEATQRLAMMEAQRCIEAERRERDKERALLYGTLPKSVADRMIRGENVTGDHYDHASVLFLDIVGFTSISDKIPPGHVVHLLSQIFTTVDRVCKHHGITKIKTIGDSYMAVSFANTENQTPNTEHVVSAGLCAVEILTALNALEITMPPELGDTAWTKEVGDIQVRIGMHCGPVTAGVIGTERMQYDVWGDTVNVASRMESSGEPGRIHVSEAFAAVLRSVDGGQWTVDSHNDSVTNDSMTLLKRGTIDIKGKGPMTTYWLEGA